MKKMFYLPNDLRNFNEIFSKNVSDDYIKSYKKLEFYPFSRKDSFGKNHWGGGSK